MKKQTISKIAAIGIAAMTVVPMFGVTASADVTFHDETNGTNANITGTAYKINWYTTETITSYKLTLDSDKIATSPQDGSVFTNTYRDATNKIENGAAPAYGNVYYAAKNVKPRDYQLLCDEIKKFNDAENTEYNTFTTAISNYNSDRQKLQNAMSTAISKTNFKDDGTVDQDENGADLVGSSSYTDSLKQNVEVIFNAAATKSSPTFTVKINDTNDSTTATLSYEYYTLAKYSYKKHTPVAGDLGKLVDDNLADNLVVEKKIYDASNPKVDDVSMKELSIDYSAYVTVNTSGELVKAAAGDAGAYLVNTKYGTGLNTPDGGDGYDKDDTTNTVPKPSDTTKPDDTTKPGDTTTKPGDTTTKPSNIGTANVNKYSGYSSAHPWYSEYTGKYYESRPDAVKDSGGNDDKKIYKETSNNTSSSSSTAIDDSSAYYSSTYHWYSSYTGRYYRTYAEALAASHGYVSYVSDSSASISSSSYYSTTYPWYSSLTRRYYRTQSDAISASGGYSSYVSYAGNTNVATDPYTYYYNLLGTNTASSNKDTSNVTIGKSKGWTAVTKTINSAKSGSTYTVTMNGETTVPTSVMSALRGKNVNINFKLSNGVTYTINGTDIESTGAMDLYTRTGTKNIPTTLKKKVVKANNGISTSQLTISDSLNGSATLTVKFNTSRAGCSAKLYRYNPASNSLALVSTANVKSTGQTSFKNVSQSGDYIIVLS